MIQNAFNGMIALLLAKFMLNDLPHAAGLTGTDYGRPATAGQLRYITVLCQQLKITVVYEEQVRTFGEAGRMIRELEAEREYRKKLKSGNPNITTKVYHATHKDNLPGIQLEGLKRQDSYIFFFSTLESARGNALSDMVILEITLLEGDIDKCEVGEIFPELYEERFGGQPPGDVSLRSYMEHPVAYGIAEVACTIDGVPPDRIRYIETISRLESSNPDTARGTCYEDAWRFLIKKEEGFLIHGSVQLSAGGPRVNHAWVELPTGWVWEPQTKDYHTIEDFRMFSPTEEHRYTAEEAAIMVARAGKHGPWTDEERMKWIGR